MTNHARAQILRRAVRFSINPDGSSIGTNSFAAKPRMSGLGRFYEIHLAIKGVPDPQTGYLIGIQEIDATVRNHIVPRIATQIEHDPTVHPGTLLGSLWEIAQNHIDHELFTLGWKLAPYYCLEMTSASRSSRSVLIRQRFEFAAAHRLHSPSMSDEENARFFGKCNNPNGHGHNYQLEPCIRVPIDRLNERNLELDLERTVNEILIANLDHKFLNIDCPWFDQSIGGVIPSVEHIARVCYEQLAPAIADLAQGVELVNMSVWETEKTSSIYPADAHTTA